MTVIDDTRGAIAAARRRHLTAIMAELADLDGETLLQAAGYLEHYDRDRLAVMFTLSADVQ